jgi:holo-[acyl-carrier protein] synthase
LVRTLNVSPDPADLPAVASIRMGIDLVAVADVERAVERFGDRYLRRVLAPAERDDQTPMTTRTLAGRIAAKEATFKVLRPGSSDPFPWTDIVVARDSSGAPRIQLSGHVARRAATEGVREVAVSITHAGGFSAAAATAIVHPPEGEGLTA